MNFTKVFQLRSIRRKLILLVSLLTILPAGILAGLTLHFHQQNFFSIEYIPIQQAAVVFKRNILLSLPAITIPAMIIGWLLLQGFTSSLQKIISGSGKSVQGDRLHRIELPSGDDAGKIAHALHTVTTELQETIASKKYAENIIQSMDDSLVVTSPDFTIRIANQSTCDLLGYNAEELTGKPIDILFCEKDTSPAPWFDFIEKDLLRKTEKTYLSKDGRKIPVLFSCNAIRGNNGNIAGIVCVALDITERKRIEADLKKAVSQKDENIKDMGYLMYFSTLMNEEVREDKLIHHMVKALQEHFQPELLAVLTIDKTKNVFDTTHMSPPIPLNKLIKPEVIADPSLCQVIRTGREIIVGNIDKDIPCECIIHKIEGGGYACLPLITGGAIAGMVLIGKRDKGYWYNEEIRKLLLVYVGLTASALQRVRLIDITRRAAITDSLTGAYNRRFFDEMLKKQIALAKRRNEPLGLILADLDHFKNINDTYGHIAGDQALQQIASIMKNSIRSSDILSRYGGEEFVIIMPSIDISNAIKKAEGLRRHIESFQFQIGSAGQPPQITISIGVSSFPDHGTEYETLIAAADLALYKAKKGGRNRVETP
ncbi:MAG: diguanylate cyclase [Candidatus Brocadia sp.]|nr:diguanylate cyclase [Candidatus Brocadia sp.]MDG6025522.1 diguanylate cyclase [Candidatus Brocadia sp.]